MNAKSNGVNVVPPPSTDQIVSSIAREFLSIELGYSGLTDDERLSPVKVNRLDLEDALEAAYVAGQVEARARLGVMQAETDLASDLAYIEVAPRLVLEGFSEILEKRYTGTALRMAKLALRRRLLVLSV
jgi:hypothetical protein